MKLKSEVKVSKAEIEALVLEHLAKNNKHNLKFGAVRFDVRESSRDDYGGYDHSDLNGATISVELELDDGREN